MLRIGLRLKKAQPESGSKLEYFRKKIMDHLSKLEKQEKTVNKAMAFFEFLMKAGFPIGTIRTWNGVRHIKMPNGKWRPKYDSQTRGAKMAVAYIKKEILAAKSEYEMMQICLKHRDRFSDKDGHPLPFLQELHEYIEGQKTVREPPKKRQKQPKSKPQVKDAESKKPEEKNPNSDILNKYGELKPGTRMTGAEWEKRGYKGYITNGRKKHKMIPDAYYTADNHGDIFEKYEDQLNRLEAKEKHLEKEPEKKDERTEMLLERLMDENFELLENYVNKEISSLEFRQELIKKKYTAEDIIKIEEFAATLKPTKLEEKTPKNPAIGPVKLVDDNGEPLNKTDMNKEFEKIQKKYKSAKAIEGDEDEVQVGKESLPGKWKLVEADTPTASHDEVTFHKTPGFPANSDGSTINDRDYGHDKAAQDAVHTFAADYDGRALKVDSPIIVTGDGIVISGNNRTMSSKIAARKGTDGKYIEALKKRAKKFGFSDDDISKFKNPRVVFEVKQEGGYTTKQFAQFNESGKKEMGPTEKAVKVAKLIKTETVKEVADKISEFDTLGELYADRLSVQHIFNSFKSAGLIGENEVGKYIEEGSITEDGKTFVETTLLGSVMSEANIRGFNRPGCKSIRAMLVRAITPLIENKSMEGYSINSELNEAVDIAMQAAINRDKFRSVTEFAQQQSMFEKYDPIAVGLAKKMDGTQKAFAEFMQSINGSMKYSANGEADIFLGGVESRDDILGRFLDLKKAVSEVLKAIPKSDIAKSLRNLEG